MKINQFTELISNIKNPNKEIIINGKEITLADVFGYMYNAKISLKLDKKIEKKINDCYKAVLKHTKNGIHIYGVNAAYGAQANYILDSKEALNRLDDSKKLSESILHTDVSVGPPIPKEITRIAMLIRVHTLSRGYSGISMEDLNLYSQLMNSQFTPIVGQYGSLGASGDLAQNARILSILRHNPNTFLWDKKGNKIAANKALKAAGIPKIEFKPKNGLGLVNGDNFSTASAVMLTAETAILFQLNVVLSAMMVQVLNGTNRSFHPMLSKVRSYAGQQIISQQILDLLDGSKLSIDELEHLQEREKGRRVQDRYSLRCLSQFLGPDQEKIARAIELLKIGINGVSDNPLFVDKENLQKKEEEWTWVSGGNFLGSYAADINDDLRRIITRLIKLNDRHLATLVNANENNGLPANLSGKESVAHCVMKGLQNQMGMFEVYSSVLTTPISTQFGVHEEGNQDVTAHGITSWILAKQLIKLLRYSIATNLIAVAQATDLRGGRKLLSNKTKFWYDLVRKSVPFVETEQPMSHFIEKIYDKLLDLQYLAKNLD